MTSPLTSVCVKWLGRKSFHDALEVQNYLARRHLDELKGLPVVGKDTLLITEHDPVYTVGIRTQDYPPSEEMRLKKLGADFVRTNRGGLVTFHGPGQLVIYPILNLNHFKKSMRWYVSQLEQTIIHTCKLFGIEASTSPYTGVWIGDNKVAAIGIHGSKFVTTHGLAINVHTDLDWFRHIDPCGIKDKGVTSLSHEMGRNLTFKDVIPAFLIAFRLFFKCNLEVEKNGGLRALFPT